MKNHKKHTIEKWLYICLCKTVLTLQFWQVIVFYVYFLISCNKPKLQFS